MLYFEQEWRFRQIFVAFLEYLNIDMDLKSEDMASEITYPLKTSPW